MPRIDDMKYCRDAISEGPLEGPISNQHKTSHHDRRQRIKRQQHAQSTAKEKEVFANSAPKLSGPLPISTAPVRKSLQPLCLHQWFIRWLKFAIVLIKLDN